MVVLRKDCMRMSRASRMCGRWWACGACGMRMDGRLACVRWDEDARALVQFRGHLHVCREEATQSCAIFCDVRASGSRERACGSARGRARRVRARATTSADSRPSAFFLDYAPGGGFKGRGLQS